MKTKQDYEARLNQQFELAQVPLTLELIEVSSVQAERVEDGRSCLLYTSDAADED